MRTTFIDICDHEYADRFYLGEIDCTHLYVRKWDGAFPPEEGEIEHGTVMHIAQLKSEYFAKAYKDVEAWLMRGVSIADPVYVTC